LANELEDAAHVLEYSLDVGEEGDSLS
jgi:hypothetical protein